MKSLLVKFVILNILNVILSTIKSISTIKYGKFVAALTNALAYGLYTVVIIYTTCDLDLCIKVLVVAVCNFVGVYIVKLIEEKSRRVKFWKIEMTILSQYTKEIEDRLTAAGIIFTAVRDVRRYTLFNCLCRTKNETRIVHKIIEEYDAHYYIGESKDF